MFIETFEANTKESVIINTDNVLYIKPSYCDKKAVFYFNDVAIETEADMETVYQTLLTERRRKMPVDLGVLSVKVVNPH